jgi:hypothetical protein
MAYSILRIKKVKSAAGVRGRAEHNTREREPPNADPSRKGENEQFNAETSGQVMARYRAMLPSKVRKNAVHAIEIIMTASPGAATPDFIAAADAWAKKTFGSGNVLHIAHHKDETTTHSHVLVMPLKDGKLNAKHYLGGSRYRLRELQDDFWKSAGEPFGLERGKPREVSGRRHDRPSLEKGLETEKKAVELERRELEAVQAAMAQALGDIGPRPEQLPPVKILESAKAYRSRIGEIVTGWRLAANKQIKMGQEAQKAAETVQRKFSQATAAVENLYKKLSQDLGGFSTFRAWFEERDRREAAARQKRREQEQNQSRVR